MLVNHAVDAIGGEYFKGAGERGLGKRMGIDPDEQGSLDALPFAVKADRLADGQDMGLVEGVVEGRTAMTGGAESHPLRDNRRIGLPE
jgi:hypothetical protein